MVAKWLFFCFSVAKKQKNRTYHCAHYHRAYKWIRDFTLPHSAFEKQLLKCVLFSYFCHRYGSKMMILLLFSSQEAKNATYPCAHNNRAYKSLKVFTLPHSAFEKQLLKCVLFSYICHRYGSKMTIFLLFSSQEAKNGTYPCAHYNRAYKSLKDFTLPHSAFEKQLLKCVLFSDFCHQYGSKMIILLLFNSQEAKNVTYPCAHYNRAYKSLKVFSLPYSAFEKQLLKSVLFSYFCHRYGSKMIILLRFSSQEAKKRHVPLCTLL